MSNDLCMIIFILIETVQNHTKLGLLYTASRLILEHNTCGIAKSRTSSKDSFPLDHEIALRCSRPACDSKVSLLQGQVCFRLVSQFPNRIQYMQLQKVQLSALEATHLLKIKQTWQVLSGDKNGVTPRTTTCACTNLCNYDITLIQV